MRILLSFIALFISLNTFAADEIEAPEDFKISQVISVPQEEGSHSTALKWTNRDDVAFYEITIYQKESSKVVCPTEAISGVFYQHLMNKCQLEANTYYIAHILAYNAQGLTKDSYLEFIGE